MRYDTLYGWVITRKEFYECGFTENTYKDGKKRTFTTEDGKKIPQIETTNRACKGNPVEIVVKTLAPKFKTIIEQHFVQLKEEHRSTMVVAKIEGANMTEAAIKVTANTLEVNAPYIRTELEDYVRKEHSTYIPYYFQAYTINRDSINGYAKICALGIWVYKMVRQINSENTDIRDINRQMRSFKANILEALDLIHPTFFEIKIPRSSQKFDAWMNSIINGLNEGKQITDIVTIKRAGNQNTNCINKDQGIAIEKLYKDPAALSVMEIYNKIVEVGKFMQWWRNKETGFYEPPSYGTIRNHIEEYKNIWSLDRTSTADFANLIVPTINRNYPVLKNMVWGIDGTAQNENVIHKGKVRQYAYANMVFDYASFRLLEMNITLGMNEKAETLIETVKGAIKEAGYKPNVLQTDQGPGYTGLAAWCESEGIKCIPSALGVARAKPIEMLIGLKDKLIDKFNKNWTGGNRTALGINSHPGEKAVKEGAKEARSFEIAKKNLRSEVFGEWNHYIIETREGKLLRKTPTELWNELESDTPKLEYFNICIICGTKHTRKLTIDGLVIQNNNIKYTYFPPIDNDEQINNAYEVFATIPRIGHQEGSQLDIYILRYGEPAPVYKNNKYWGMWTVKSRVDMFATITKNTDNYDKFRAFQELFKANAIEANKAVDEEFSTLACAPIVEEIKRQPLTGRKRITPLLDKSNLNAEEIMAKAGVETPDAVETLKEELEERTFINELTGEITTYKAKKQ